MSKRLIEHMWHCLPGVARHMIYHMLRAWKKKKKDWMNSLSKGFWIGYMYFLSQAWNSSLLVNKNLKYDRPGN